MLPQTLRFCRERVIENANCDFVLACAALYGFCDIIGMCKDSGAISFDIPILIAAEYGHVDIVSMCKNFGVVSVDGVAAVVAKNGHIEIVVLCREWGAKQIRQSSVWGSRK